MGLLCPEQLGDLVVDHGWQDGLVGVLCGLLEGLVLVGLVLDGLVVGLRGLEVVLPILVDVVGRLALVVLSVVELLEPCSSFSAPWLLL